MSLLGINKIVGVLEHGQKQFIISSFIVSRKKVDVRVSK